MSAQIIDFATARNAAVAPAPDPLAGFKGEKPFNGLAFVSPETTESGWPKKHWIPRQSSSEGRADARAAVERLMYWPGDLWMAGSELSRVLEALIFEQAAKRAKGGKGSHSTDSYTYGFLHQLCDDLSFCAGACSGEQLTELPQ